MDISDGHVIVDSRGALCPQPITDLALAYRRLKAGDIIELWATDLSVKSDARAWAARTGDEILSIDEQDDKIVVVLRVAGRLSGRAEVPARPERLCIERIQSVTYRNR